MAGSNPGLVIRVAADLDELKRNFADMSGMIETEEHVLESLAASFRGDEILQNAHHITAAVLEIGGATKLTADEQAKVNYQLTQAIEKYEALGQEAPADMIALAEATKQVDKQTSGLTTSMVAVGTFVGQLGLDIVKALGEMALNAVKALATELGSIIVEGSGVADIADAFDRLTGAAGLLGDTLLTRLAEGTHHTVTNLDLMKTVNRDLAAGLVLSEQQFGTLAEGAFALANATGIEVKQAFDQLNDAMLTGRTRGLELLTGRIDLKTAEEEYAAKLGKTADQLTADESLYVAREAILKSVTDATQRLGEQTDGLDELIAQATTAWQNFRAELGEAINKSGVLTAGLEALKTGILEAFGGNQQAVVDTVTRLINNLAIAVVQTAIKFTEFAEFAARAFGVVRGPIDAVSLAIVYLVERFAAGIAKIAELAAQVPGVGSALEGVAATARSTADAWAVARQRAEENMAAHDALAKGQGPVIDAIRGTRTVLEGMHTAMVAARDATKETGTAAAEAAPKIVALAPAVQQVTPAVESMTQSFETGIKDLPPLTGLLGNLEKTMTSTVPAISAVGDAAIDMSQDVRFAAETVAEAAAVAEASWSSWAESMDAVRAGQGTMSGSIRSSGNVLIGTAPGTWAATAAEMGGVVRFDDYGNPFVDTSGRGRGQASPVGAYTSQYDFEQRYGALGAMVAGGAGASVGGAYTANVNVSTVMGDKYEIARVVKDALAEDWRALGQRG